MQNAKESNENDLIITRIFNAPRELVWQAWTEEKHVEKWFSPKGFTVPLCQWDAKPGNTIIVHMQGPDGITYPMDGKFIELVKPEKLVFISAALDKDGKRLFEVHNTVTFTEEGSKTKLTLEARVSKVRSEGMRNIDGMNLGWNQTLDKLEDLLKTL